MKNKLKEMKGITLIALVITIIVLLILAGVSIAMLTGENGILTQANNAKNKTQEAEADEIFKLIANEWQIEKRKGTSLETFLDDKKVEYGIEYEADGEDYILKYNGEKVKLDNNGILTEVTQKEETTTLVAGVRYTDGTFKSWDTLVSEGVVGSSYIGQMAFCGDDTIETIIVAESVTSIAETAIVGCSNLTTIVVLNPSTTISPNNAQLVLIGAFNTLNSLEAIYYDGDLAYAPWGASDSVVVKSVSEYSN